MLRAVSSIPEYIGSFTYATLPAASASLSGFRAFVTDWGAYGAEVRCNAAGTRWVPVNGRVLLKHLGAAQTGIANTATIAIQTPAMPAGTVQANDTFLFDIPGITKSGTTDALTAAFYAGTAGTTSDTSLATATTMLSTAQQSGSALFAFKVVSNTSILRAGPIAQSGLYSGGNNNAANAAVTVTDLSANALIFSFSIASTGTTNTVGLQDGSIWQIAH